MPKLNRRVIFACHSWMLDFVGLCLSSTEDAAQLASSIRQVLERGRRSNGCNDWVCQGLTARAVAAQLGRLYDRLRGETSFACAG